MDALNNRGAAAPGLAAPKSGDAPTVRGGRGVKGEAQAQAMSHRDSTRWLALCVRVHELRDAVMLRVARTLGVRS